MLSRFEFGWNELDEAFSAINQFKDYFDRAFEDIPVRRIWSPRALFPTFGGSWPRANLIDNGSSITVTAEVPGLSEKDINLSLNQDVLTLAGERKTEAPEEYITHRRERAAVQFSRSFSLPCAVDPEHTTATVKDGILTVTLEKAKEAQPRQITVKAS